MNYPHLANAEAYRAFYNEGYPAEITGMDPFRQSYMRYFCPKLGESIVDLGSGTGSSVIHYARAGHPCTGVEVSLPMLNVGREAGRGLMPEPQWAESLIEDWTPDRRYDHVLLTEVLEHVIDPVAVLAKARDAGREVFITAPTEHVGTHVHVRGVPVDQLRTWLEEVGLTIQVLLTRASVLCGVRYRQVVCRCVS